MIRKIMLLFISLFFSSPYFASAQGSSRETPLDRFHRYSDYALNCPGQSRSISSLRFDWLRFDEKIEGKFNTLEEETDYQYRRLLKMSKYAALKFDPKNIKYIYSLIRWAPKIKFQNEALHLPSAIAGCTVIPIFAKVEGQWLGSLDDFNQMTALDQLILLSLIHPEDEIPLRMLLTERNIGLSLREKLQYINSLQYADEEIYRCDSWYDDNHPKECIIKNGDSVSNFPKGKALHNSRIFFNAQGEIIKFSTHGLQTIPLHLRIASRGTTTCMGTVTYRDDLSLKDCLNGETASFFDTSGRTLLHSPGTPVKTLNSTLKSDLTFYSAEGKPLYTSFAQYQRGERLPPPFDKYLLEPSNRQFSTTVSFHENGQIKSGIFSLVDQPNQEHMYIEFNKKGQVQRKISGSAQSQILTQMYVATNTKSVPQTFTFEKKFQILEMKHLASSTDCPSSVIINKDFSFLLPPNCSAVFYSLVERKW